MANDPLPTDPAQLPPGQKWTRKLPVEGENTPPPEALNLDSWRLEVTGEVAVPRLWTYAEFLQLPQIEVTTDIHCVTRWSRPACRWKGIPFTALADKVHPFPSARFVQFIAFSERDHDTSLPIELCLNGGVLFAHSCDGAPLSPAHGYPLRTVAPSRYFYKSLKWVREVRFLEEDSLGYWERTGYHNNADFRQEERFVAGNLTPAEAARLRAGGDVRRLQGKVLVSVDLRGAMLAGKDLAGVVWRHCDLQEADLRGANLKGANLTGCDLSHADLRSTNLTEADLSGVRFFAADLRGAVLRRALLNGAQFHTPGREEPQLQDIDWTEAILDGVTEDQTAFLEETRLRKPGQ